MMFLEKKKLLACSSGGRTSMYQLEWLLQNKRDEYDITGIFANTSWEHPLTLKFVHQCSERWKELYDFHLVWVEAVVHEGRIASTHKVVDYNTCKKNGEVFSEMCEKYGVPNVAYPHCTRELKENPIHDYVKTVLGWYDYETAIGIRIDEPKRIKRNKTKQNKVYPLVDWHPDKPDKLDIIDWWEGQDFDLQIPEHLGNCVGCFKKSKNKLLKAIRDGGAYMINDYELKYGHIGPNKIDGVLVDEPRTMYRGNLTIHGMVDLYFEAHPSYLRDDTEETNEGCASSCEPFIDESMN